MSHDFVGLRVIWPPDDTLPPGHDQDIVFVHGLHHGSISDWEDEHGICWPSVYLSLDLGATARILAFGYDTAKPVVTSDGHYAGGVLFNHGESLWSALRTRRKYDQTQVPITFVGHGMGCIVVHSALCIPHFRKEQVDPILRKTKHVVMLSPPPINLSWETWRDISEGTASAKSKGQWKVWSAVHSSSMKSFDNVSKYINVTPVLVGSDSISGPETLNLTAAVHHNCISCNELTHVTISQDIRRHINYTKLVELMQNKKSLVINEVDEIQRIRSWLGRQPDKANNDSHKRNIYQYLTGTCKWLFQDRNFREWSSPEGNVPVLWLVGPEGSGKSTLCSLAVERMRSSLARPAVVYLFLSFDKPRSEYYLVTQIALQLLEYVVQQLGGVDAEALLTLPKEHDVNKMTFQVQSLIRILISQCPAVFIFVDGLDEVGSSEELDLRLGEKIKHTDITQQLHSVLTFLGELANDADSGPIRLWCSSRQTKLIDKWMRELKAHAVPVMKQAVAVDIAQTLEHRSKMRDQNVPSESKLPSAITIDQLPEASKNNFVFASLLADRLEQPSLSSQTSMQADYQNSPESVTDLYQERMNQLLEHSRQPGHDTQQRSLLALQIISIVTYAKRPLNLAELQEALAISRISLKNAILFNLEPEHAIDLDVDRIQVDCAPFISFSYAQNGRKDGYARLAHASASSFLRELAQKGSTTADNTSIGPNLISGVCLKYLCQRKYCNNELSSLSGHEFYTYAAKYWHRHVDEADSDPELIEAAGTFVRSCQFLTLIRFQSFLLDRHFAHAPRSSAINIPQSLTSKADMQGWVEDYKSFIREWCGYLGRGITAVESKGLLEQCFWGALGSQNALRKHGLGIEEHRSFLLEAPITAGCQPHASDKLHNTVLYETVSEDGSQVSVWHIPAQLAKDSDINTSESFSIIRESWIIDGINPPCRDGNQEEIDNETASKMRFPRSKTEHTFPLITNSDTFAHAPTLDEFSFGKIVRIGSQLFHCDENHIWSLDQSNRYNNAGHWDSIITRGPWTVYSNRRQATEDLEDSGSREVTADEGIERSPSARGKDDAHATTHTPSLFEDMRPQSSLGFEEGLDSAEEFSAECLSDSDLGSPSSDDDLWMSSEADSESKAGEHDEILAHDDANQTIQSSTNGAVEQIAAEESYADDEDTPAPNDIDLENRPADDLKHICVSGMTCNICSRVIVPYKVNSRVAEERFYQCSLCSNEDSFDICSQCFMKGEWCERSSHLLSECVFVLQEKHCSWKDGMSQHSAIPLIKIVAGSGNGQPGHLTVTASFKYQHRHADILHGSEPIVHQSLPLLIYPLDGHKFLFGNMEGNRYFIYDIPFDLSETAETSGGTCIPVSVDLRFSKCGKYLYVLRFTARSDDILGPIALQAVIFTVEMSLKNPCAKKPTMLPIRRNIHLGTWPRMVSRLPYAITWTDSYVYISMSDIYLRVFRLPLGIEETRDTREGDLNRGACVSSRRVTLPHSAQSRSIKFFPNKDNTPAKIILGSLHGSHPQPPIIVYLNAADGWTLTAVEPVSSPHFEGVRNDIRIEEPNIDDDDQLVKRPSQDEGTPLLEPIMLHRPELQNKWQTGGIYCPSCFELGSRIGFFRAHPTFHIRYFDESTMFERPLKLEWRVSATSLIAALQAGCQFCCYVVTRMFTLSHIRVFNMSMRDHGVRCCSQGSDAKDPDAIQEIINKLSENFWRVPLEKQMHVFHCEPRHWNFESKSFDKLALTLPYTKVGGSDGNLDDVKFDPIMVTVKGRTSLGEFTSLTMFQYPGKSSRPVTEECVLELHALPVDGGDNLITTRPLTTSYGEGENIKVIQGWLQDCQSSHNFCPSNTNADLPTRLVKIIDSTTVMLVETADKSGRYIALSYCWGSPFSGKNYMTIATNLEARSASEGLPRDELPAAIRDAITITESLGIQYIWIDALCIIQDDLKDKESELGKMSQYYRNSFLTIAASTPNAATGFIGKRGRCEEHADSSLPRDLVPLNAVVHVQNSGGWSRASKIYVREENPYQFHEECINHRAWTLQECVLAPRLLMFGGHVTWFCQHKTQSDGGVEDWSFDENDLDGTRRELQVQLRKLEHRVIEVNSNSKGRKSDYGTQDIYGLWHRLVGAYSRRALTWPSDKLPAISAIATEFSKLTRSNYLAGLWRSNLPRDLLWTTYEAATHRASTWRAPTWSWASVTDPVLYKNPPPGTAKLLVEILDVELLPSTSLCEFGELKQGGTLVLTAPSIRMTVNNTEDGYKVSKPWLDSFKMNGGTTERALLLDVHNRFSDSEKREESERVVAPKKAGDIKEKDFRLPDECFVVFIYGQREDLFRSYDTTNDMNDTTQEWLMWGLILKKATTDSPAGDQFYERVLSFSQIRIKVGISLSKLEKKFCII